MGRSRAQRLAHEVDPRWEMYQRVLLARQRAAQLADIRAGLTEFTPERQHDRYVNPTIPHAEVDPRRFGAAPKAYEDGSSGYDKPWVVNPRTRRSDRYRWLDVGRPV